MKSKEPLIKKYVVKVAAVDFMLTAGYLVEAKTADEAKTRTQQFIAKKNLKLAVKSAKLAKDRDLILFDNYPDSIIPTSYLY